MWLLFGWSGFYGAATTLVAVLGLEETGGDGVSVAIAWNPDVGGGRWFTRLATTGAEDLRSELDVWALCLTDPAIRLDPSSRHPDLHRAVQLELHDRL